MKDFATFCRQIDEEASANVPSAVLSKLRDAIKPYLAKPNPDKIHGSLNYKIHESDTQKALQALEKTFGKFKTMQWHYVYEQAGIHIQLGRDFPDVTPLYNTVQIYTF